MELGFLFWFYFVGLIIVACQDLKRREIDDWLNLLMLVGGCVFVFYDSFLGSEMESVFVLAFLLLFMFFVQLFFYGGRVFAGGDAKLLFAMTPLFLASGFYEGILNVCGFVLFLMVGGSIYGLIYSLSLYFRNFKRVNRKIGLLVCDRWSLVAGLLVLGFLLFCLGFLSSFFFIAGGWVVLFVLFLVFAKGLEGSLMIREVGGKDLVEGDWLVEDVSYSERKDGEVVEGVVRSRFEGLSSADLKLLRRKRKVLIKDGIPFGPAFIVALILYVFFEGWFWGLLGF